jgi:hypothetical protein
MRNHPGIKERLESSGFLNTLEGMSDLTPEQINSVRARAEYLCANDKWLVLLD